MKHLRWALAALVLFAGIGHTAAGTVTSDLRVQALVLITCTVTGATLDFGGVDVTKIGGDRPKAGINVTCPIAVAFQVGIDNGSNALNGQRRMKHDTSADFLSYELYKHATGPDRFGDAIISERVGGVGLGHFVPIHIHVYGQILAGQDPPGGNYLDNAVVTVYF